MTPVTFYLILAVVLISTELLAVQFTVFWFLFFGLGALATAILMWLVPEVSWFASTLFFLLSSIVVTAIFYPGLKKWQDQKSPIAGNDAIGQKTEVIVAIDNDKSGKVMWSGSEWPAELAEGQDALAVGETAKIHELEGIRLIVGR